MNKQIRNKGFYTAVLNKIKSENPDLAAKISIQDMNIIFDTSFRVMAELLKDGYRVILEGYFSFFTKPIKRKCTNLHNKNNDETWWTLKKRVRIKALDHLKDLVETEISNEEYNQYKSELSKKKSPAS